MGRCTVFFFSEKINTNIQFKFKFNSKQCNIRNYNIDDNPMYETRTSKLHGAIRCRFGGRLQVSVRVTHTCSHSSSRKDLICLSCSSTSCFSSSAFSSSDSSLQKCFGVFFPDPALMFAYMPTSCHTLPKVEEHGETCQANKNLINLYLR